MAIVYRGERFSGYNKPKRTPKHKTKSHAVLAKKGDTVKLIRFGYYGTLIRETKTHKFARTHNGKVKKIKKK